ncbi:hypothetical protein [Candidatus Thiodiazotropha sp. LNASS1]|uniref:hypothetical protein n=1 Tax=Candidatus Thiodiazotropha sp. LNASS1 TaxID=3096260 RepID=UPI0034E0098A
MKFIRNTHAVSFIFAYIGSLVSVLGIFLLTMFVHYQHLDSVYLKYASIRILIISVVPGILGAMMYKRSKITQFLIGMVIGPIIGVIHILIFIGL